MSPASRRPAVVAAALLALSLTACSADDEPGQAFCDEFAALESDTAELTTLGADDPDTAAATFDEITTALTAIEAPAEVADAYAVYAAALETYAEAATQALADPANADQDAVAAATQGMTSEATGQAMASLATYSAENCA